MLIVRLVFQAKPGQAREVAQAMRQDMRMVIGDMRRASGWRALTGGDWRVMTSVIGPLDTVLLEFEVQSVAEWEGFQRTMFANPGFQTHFARIRGMIDSGYKEMYLLEGEG